MPGADATVATQSNTGAPKDYGECPTHKGKRLIRMNRGNGKFQCEVDRHEVKSAVKGTGWGGA